MPRQEESTTVKRMDLFSDAVIAVLITIMVLEMRVPDALAVKPTWEKLEPFADEIGIYALSFIVLAIMWVNHHDLTEHVGRVTMPILWLNNLQLFMLSLVPLATQFYGEHPRSAWAADAYALVLAANAFVLTAYRIYIARRRETGATHRAEQWRLVGRSLLGTLIYVAAMPLAFVRPWMAAVCFIAVPAIFFFPSRPSVGGWDRRLRRRLAGEDPGQAEG